MSRDVQSVINPSCNPVVAVASATAVTCKVIPFISGEVGLDKPLRIAIHGPHLAATDPRGEIPQLHRLRCDSSLSTRTGVTPKGASVADPGLRALLQGGSNLDPPGFRLPPRIHDGTALLTNNVVVPRPGLRFMGSPTVPRRRRLRRLVRVTGSFPSRIRARRAMGAV